MAAKGKTGKTTTRLPPGRGAAMTSRPGFPQPPVSAIIYSLGDSWFTYPTIFDQDAPINLIRALDAAPQPRGAKYFLE
jgi:hypothetical protein